MEWDSTVPKNDSASAVPYSAPRELSRLEVSQFKGQFCKMHIKITQADTNSQTGAPKEPLTLRILPPELREKVFKYALQLPRQKHFPSLPPAPSCPHRPQGCGPRHKSQTPSFLIAVRGDMELYGEALKVYYAVNKFYLNLKNVRSFTGLGHPAMNLIKRLQFVVPYVNSLSDLRNETNLVHSESHFPGV